MYNRKHTIVKRLWELETISSVKNVQKRIVIIINQQQWENVETELLQ